MGWIKGHPRLYAIGGVFVVIGGGLATIEGVWSLFNSEPLIPFIVTKITFSWPLWIRWLALLLFASLTVFGIILLVTIFKQTRTPKIHNLDETRKLGVGKLLLDGKEILVDLEKMNAQLDSMGVVSAELKFEIWYKDVSKTLQNTDYDRLWFENKEGLDYRTANKSDYVEACKYGLGRLEYIKQLIFDKEGSQSLGDGIQPKSYDKRDVIISNEPEISIDIDKCSVLSYGQSDQAIEVALTLKVKSPPINIADFQLYMGDEMLKLLSPAMPITQRNNKECYMTKYKLSLGTIYKVEKDSRDKYHIRVVTKRQEVDSEVFSINNP